VLPQTHPAHNRKYCLKRTRPSDGSIVLAHAT
jgi:hypothetical protein